MSLTPLTLGILALILLSGCTFSSGTTKDVVQGYDKGILWHHAYLLNDHHTVYCFDDDKYIAIFDTAQKTNQKVVVHYETYLLRGLWCLSSENYDNVIVTGVE